MQTFYVGVVVNNNDEEKKLQRIKVRIRDIHRNVRDEQLPWCLPISALFGSGAEIGQFGPIPTIHSKVYVTYLDQSPYYPVYLGGVVSEDRQLDLFTAKGGLGDDYPYVYGHIDRSGNVLIVNTKRNTKHTQHLSLIHI